MLLLDLMAINELEEVINLLRKDLFKIAATQGFSDKRTIEMNNRLDLYQNRYDELTKQLHTEIEIS